MKPIEKIKELIHLFIDANPMIKTLIALIIYTCMRFLLPSFTVVMRIVSLFSSITPKARYKPNSDLLDDPKFIGYKNESIKDLENEYDELWERYDKMTFHDKQLRGTKIRFHIEFLRDKIWEVQKDILKSKSSIGDYRGIFKNKDNYGND